MVYIHANHAHPSNPPFLFNGGAKNNSRAWPRGLLSAWKCRAVMDAYESTRLAHGSAIAPCLIEVHSVGHFLPSAQVGKMLLSSGTAQLGLLCYVPASKLDKCNASEWMRATLA